MSSEEGLAERSEGVERNLTAADGTEYRRWAEEVLGELIAMGRPFSADHVRSMIPSTLVPHHPNVLPSLFAHASQAGRIRPVGEVRSNRKVRHGSLNRLWVSTASWVQTKQETLEADNAALREKVESLEEDRQVLSEVLLAVREIAADTDTDAQTLVHRIKEVIP